MHARALLRSTLAAYLGCEPPEVEFSYSDNGKPSIPDSELTFNLSHSRDLLLIAVSAGRRIGIDIEHVRENVRMDDIASRWFAPEERARFQQAADPQPVFFDIWTKKEAYVKATGGGIFDRLHTFSVPESDGTACYDAKTHWTFQRVNPDPDYAAALVFEGPPKNIEVRSN